MDNNNNSAEIAAVGTPVSRREQSSSVCSGSESKKRKVAAAAAAATCSTPPKTIRRRTPNKAKDKSANSTPRKNGRIIQTNHSSPPVMPNLRLEAKLTAQENSRMFAGKQLHPFFSSWKAGKKIPEVVNGDETSQGTLQTETTSTRLAPVHISDKTMGELVSLDWGNWIFHERTLGGDPGLADEGMISSAFGDLFQAQCLNKVSSVSSGQNKSFLDQCVIQLDDLPPTISTVLECEMDNVFSCSGDVGRVRKPDDDEPHIGILQERIVSARVECGNEPTNKLWTVKYQPNKATEVCGNSESVKFMSEWLHLWHGKNVQAVKEFTSSDKCKIEDDNYTCCKSDADSDYENEGTSLKNILLVTGPVGSGKSAAVYACAKEQGFRVFECNASECRNGALVKHKLGEVLESHCLPRSRNNHGDSLNKLTSKSEVQRNGKTVQENGIEVVELTSDEESSDGEYFFKDSQTSYSQGPLKPLILFEDVDITFSEDRGFINSVIRIAKTAKGPVILTTNSKDPVLPENLRRLEVHFRIPSHKDLLGYLNMIGAAEKVKIQPHLMEKLIECCEGDIRKAIMHLQFWYQGRRFPIDKVHEECNSLILDLDVDHRLLPKLIPWAFPSQLSEFVEKEISKALFVMEENSTFMDIVKQTQNGVEMHDDKIESNKNSMLNGCDFSNPLDTPIAQKKCKRKLSMEMSYESDFENERGNNLVSPATDKDIHSQFYLEEDSTLISHCPNLQKCTCPLSNEQPCGVENISHKFSETYHDMEGNVAVCKPVAMSCVPESLFVPETKVDDGIESETVDAFVNNEIERNLSVDINGSPIGSLLKLHKFLDLNVIAESNNEEMMDNLRTESINICSSPIDLNKTSKPFEEHVYCTTTNLVQESWKRLYDNHTDLKQFASSEEKTVSRVLKLALGVTNVISEADILLSGCQMLDVATVPSEEAEVFNRSNKQFQMISTIAENGFFFYAKDIPATNLDISSERRINLTEEMLPSSANIMKYGTFIEQDERVLTMSSEAENDLPMNPPESEMLLRSKLKSDTFDIIKSIVPLKSLLALNGISRHEYLSSLGCISRSEALRISGGGQNTRKRRGRVARHYLSSLMSPEDISLVAQYDLGRKCLSNPEETNNFQNRT
ncbi:hypothetical protein ACFE04_012257 [Oxalis oulophora]